GRLRRAYWLCILWIGHVRLEVLLELTPEYHQLLGEAAFTHVYRLVLTTLPTLASGNVCARIHLQM
ncbi:MAG TPA: hypothetical protein VLK33_01975, partial [Terriglobales bacterium]|nr:hypothetical protein [Terriglobales bacterium]